jgi:ribose/xylose/arabinose/galactoside ABC-type transport system permease subunit
MKAISEVSTRAVSETQTNVNVLNVIGIICGLGVVVLVCLATSGLDLSVGFF